jgi:hypothetical protein
VRALPVALVPADAAPSGPRPDVVALQGGRLTSTRSCVILSGQDLRAELRVRPGGLALKPAGAGPVTVRVRRFADSFPTAPSWQVQPGAASMLRLPPGRSERPWLAALEGPGDVTACAAAG